MKKFMFIMLALFPIGGKAQEVYLFNDNKIPDLFIQLPADSLDFMLEQLVNRRYMPAQMIFSDGVHRDTLNEVGLRLRGNTSLYAQKKSFKISFNAFNADGEYQGVRKLNLLGSHNDPTMIREKLFYEVWNEAGMPERRSNFVNLYINSEYRGLYTNIEEIDKRWLSRHYPDNDGNLYKCTYPADLAYLGENQGAYKSILNNPQERAYDLVTNESADDYARLIALIRTLNGPVDADFKSEISQILHVESVLKSLAIDVATGNWDDYFYNKNNFYLYDNPSTGRFEFVTYDTDNTFGVDWLGKDWATRDCLTWFRQNEPRPLISKLFQVSEFFFDYVGYLDEVTRKITSPDSIFPLVDHYRDLVSASALSDYYRTLDYGYTYGSYYAGFTETVDDHTPYGIKPFLSMRKTRTLTQIEGLVGTLDKHAEPMPSLRCYPNPAADEVFIWAEWPVNPGDLTLNLYSTEGLMLKSTAYKDAEMPIRLDVKDLPSGCHFLQVKGANTQAFARVIVLGH